LLGHNNALYDDLTAAENLIFSLRMAGRRADADAIAGALEQVGLTHVRRERVRGFSAGMRRRLGLARLLLRPPRLLLLDERTPASTRMASTWSTSSRSTRRGRAVWCCSARMT
jgi:heme exporter protein A